MSWIRARSALGLLVLAMLAAPDAGAAEIVKDGSFESTVPPDDNPNWEEFSLSFGSPICGDDCQTVSGERDTVGPRTGKNWVWFGGTVNPEQAFVSQEVTIPAGSATLTFYLWIGNSSSPFVDVFRVTMDGRELLTVVENASGYGSYTLVRLDVSQYAGSHELSFEFEGFGGGVTNISLDDISLQTGPAGAGGVKLKGPKSVAEGRKAKLKATVQPCSGHQGETIELFRGKKKVASKVAGPECTVTFKVKINRTSTFRAVSPAGSSNKVKVRAR